MSQITSSIYLGDINVARNYQQLKKWGITHIINLSQQPNAFPHQFQYLTIDIPDHPRISIVRYFPQTNQFITEALRQGGKIFIHCMAGISRSSSVVIAYLMQSHRYPFRETFKFVQSRRPIINPNSGFMHQLMQYGIQSS